MVFQYSSRDEVLSSSSESKATPRFGSLASPTSYRPSYSGGTYRSIGIRRDMPSSSSYSSRWLNKETLPKETAEPKKSPVKLASSDVKSSKSAPIASASSLLTNKTKTTTKEAPSLARPSVTLAKARIRDLNSASSTYSAPKSRDPSPCDPAKDRYTSTSGYVSSSYNKLYPRSSNKLQVNSISNSRPALRSTNSAVSYLNGTDVGGKYRQNIDFNEKLTKTSSDERSPVSEAANGTAITAQVTAPVTVSLTPSSSSSSAISSDSGENSDSGELSTEMVEVTVVTRATSPNLCPSSVTSFSRCRRVEIAKTIEKTIKRPKRSQHKTADKEIQSDRMDDTSKYSRYSSSTRSTTPWPSYMEKRFGTMSYARYNSGTNMTSVSKYSSTKNEKDSNENSPEKSIETDKTPSKSSRESSLSKSPSISRSNSLKTASKSDKSKSKSPPSVPSAKSTSASPPKQKVYTNKALPPQPPKLESPTKVISVTAPATPASLSPPTTSGTGCSKWANKDSFKDKSALRKSALNVGQTDRPRKARSSSACTENEECNSSSSSSSKKAQQKPATQMLYTRADRSPSVGSETSYSSGGNAADDMMKKLKISPHPIPTMASSASPPMMTEASAVATSSPVNECVTHTNSNMMTYDTAKTQQNIGAVQPSGDSSHTSSGDSCTKLDNAKSSTIVNRVLGPVVKMFKNKTNPSGDSQSNSDHDSANSTNESHKQDTSLLNRTPNTSSAAKLVSSNNYLADESNSWVDSTVNEQTTDTQFDRFQSNQSYNMKSPNANTVSWWFNNEPENDFTVAEDITLNQSDDETIRIDDNNNNGRIDAFNDHQTNQSIPWWMVDETPTATVPTDRSDANKKYRITHIQSGERAWWLGDDDTEESVNDILEAAAATAQHDNNYDNENDDDNNNNSVAKFTLKLKKIETGERSWWFCEENQDADPNESVKHTASSCSNGNNGKEENPDIDFWATINESLEADKRHTSNPRADAMRQHQNDKPCGNGPHYDINANYIPLGDRASPEGLEDFNNNSDKFDTANMEFYFKKLFISKHQNIDEVLGAPCHALSPIRVGNDDDEPFQEILPTQVRIHDGTAKTIHLTTERYDFHWLFFYRKARFS